MEPSPKNPANKFADESRRPPQGLIREFIDFLRHNKKWFLVPIVVMLLLLGALVVLSGTVLAPLIYPLL